jgi:hypothetical protein
VAIKISNSTIIDDSRNIVNAGITSVTSVSIGNTEVISAARQLKNIASLDATTTATIETAVANAPNTFTDLNVTGITTLANVTAGIVTATFVGNITGNLNSAGVNTATTISGTTATYTTGNFTTGNIVTGIVTSISGTNLNYTGIGTITNITNTNINTSGVTTTARLNVGTGGTIITTTIGGFVGINSTVPGSMLSVGGTITELYAGQYWNLVSQADVGIGASQVPLNQYLGQLAFVDDFSPTTLIAPRIQSVGEKTSIISGNTASLTYNTGGGNIAICTNPSGDITLAVAGIPTDSTFDNTSLTFSVFVNQTGTARSCTAVTLNGLSASIRWAGGSLSAAISGVTTTSGMDIYNFTGINTVGSASTTANYYVLGVVNGGFR